MTSNTPTPAPAPMTASLAARLRELMEEATPGPIKAGEALPMTKADIKFYVGLVNNAPTILRLLEALEGMEKAIEPFRGAYDVKPPTADKWPDDKPLHECLPGIWPTWGDLKRLREALATLRAAREGAR